MTGKRVTGPLGRGTVVRSFYYKGESLRGWWSLVEWDVAGCDYMMYHQSKLAVISLVKVGV